MMGSIPSLVKTLFLIIPSFEKCQEHSAIEGRHSLRMTEFYRKCPGRILQQLLVALNCQTLALNGVSTSKLISEVKSTTLK
jgi:hypothetical protein